MKLIMADDRETILGKSTYQKCWYHLQPALVELYQYTVLA
jgi:hypothetical protein